MRASNRAACALKRNNTKRWTSSRPPNPRARTGNRAAARTLIEWVRHLLGDAGLVEIELDAVYGVKCNLAVVNDGRPLAS